MIIKGFLITIVVLFSYSPCFSKTPAELVQENKYGEAKEAYHKAIKESQDQAAKAILHKELGDLFASRGDFKNAGGEYVKALSLSRKFSEKDRLQMATRMSWGKWFDEAITELQLLLTDNPQNFMARIQLARVMSWTGRLRESLRETDRILEAQPDNKDALLVKANALRWQGHVGRAIILYRGILEKEEDFDSRMGLTYAYLSAGNIKAAKESRKFLKPKYPYQENDLKQLNVAMDRAISHNLGAGYSHYGDSDDNRTYRYFLDYGFWLDNWKMDFHYRHTGAKDNSSDVGAEELSFKTYSKPKEFLGLGGGVGVVQFKNGTNSNFLTWNMRTDVNVWNGVAGLALSGEGITDTAQLIKNQIRATSLGLSLSQRLMDRVFILGSYSYRDYSDSNHVNDFLFSPAYSIYTRNPTINLGYRFRYLNFSRQSGGGYFDPHDFISHQAFISLSFEHEKFYVYIEPYGGYQSFNRYGENKADFFGGGSGTLGLNLSKNILLEVNAEGGNYAMGAAAGFNYYLVGIRLQLFL